MEAGLLGVVALVGLVGVGHLNMCHGIGVLAPVFDGIANRARYVAACEEIPWNMLVSVVARVLTGAIMVWHGQHRRSGVSHLPGALVSMRHLAELVAGRVRSLYVPIRSLER